MPVEKTLESHRHSVKKIVEPSQMMKNKIFFHPKSIAITLLAVLGIYICLNAAQWQFNRGYQRHADNVSTKRLLSQTPMELRNDSKFKNWSKVTVEGNFDTAHEVLVRGRYRADKYGYGVLTLFRSSNLLPIWVDRGWIEAVGDATQIPIPPAPPKGKIEIEGLLRTFAQVNAPSGSLIAYPTSKIGKIEISLLDQNYNSGKFDQYLQLTSDLAPSPILAELPTFSDGPHYAYSLQWAFFVLLILVGRILIAREELRNKLPGVKFRVKPTSTD